MSPLRLRVIGTAGCGKTVVAQRVFERAVAMLHSFWFAEAEKTFREATQKDPACAMAHWGIAMVKLGNPSIRPPSNVAGWSADSGFRLA